MLRFQKKKVKVENLSSFQCTWTIIYLFKMIFKKNLEVKTVVIENMEI